MTSATTATTAHLPNGTNGTNGTNNTLTPSPPATSPSPTPIIETPILIIGAGPSGSSLASFLTRLHHTGILLSSAPSTAHTPRAHITNPPALECLKDLDPAVYDDCIRLSNTKALGYLDHFRWCETMAGEEYARVKSWGTGRNKGVYEEVSACSHVDLCQDLLEPMLVKYASTRGFGVRFSTKLVGFVEEVVDVDVEEKEKGDDGKRFLCTVRDRITGIEYQIRTRFLFGADGARSLVVDTLKLPMSVIPGGGLAFNILVRCDLEHLMKHRQGNLHWCLRLDKDYPFLCVGRMVKPWYEWMFVLFPKGPHAPPPRERSNEEWGKVVKDMIGDESVTVEVVSVSRWLINETSADVISKGNAFCLGDAVHRHPPTLGLGSNTCIQDAFNLSWKISYVLRGLASPSLLQTYNAERQPVGAHLVKTSNEMLRKAIAVWLACGAQPYGAPEEERIKSKSLLREDSDAGAKARKVLVTAMKDMEHETNALGTEMGQLYTGQAVYSQDELEPLQLTPKELKDPVLHYEPSSYPGRRLPHVWLGSRIPGPLVSTLDVAGKGKFTLFTGIGGTKWKGAAASVTKELGLDVNVVSIGLGLEWEDVYREWDAKRCIKDSGAILVRPDFFVAWRAHEGGDEQNRLTKVLKSILGLA